MTSALVVYESGFGDAHALAHAVGEGLSTRLPAVVMDARHAPESLGPEVGLLVVGCSDSRLGMPRQRSREGAGLGHGEQPAASRQCLRKWLLGLSSGHGRAAAAFDIRMPRPGCLDHADHAPRVEERLLADRGFEVVTPAEHFVVLDVAGPLKDGEADRARAWGRTLAVLVAHHLAAVAD